jgi:hypothetical protein
VAVLLRLMLAAFLVGSWVVPASGQDARAPEFLEAVEKAPVKRVDQDATGATIMMRAKRRCRIAGRA